jgi:hypothetical protein
MLLSLVEVKSSLARLVLLDGGRDLTAQPEAQHPKSSAIHKPQADYPI